MRQDGQTVEEQGRGRKRLLATGRKINGTWEVRTFLRDAAAGVRQTFWESRDHRPASAKKRGR